MTAHDLQHYFSDELHWCGCGRPESPACLVRELLRACPFYANRTRVEELLPREDLEYFVLYALSHADLIEHGGSVGGSWITKKGQSLLEALEELTKSDPDLESIFDEETMWKGCEKCIIKSEPENQWK